MMKMNQGTVDTYLDYLMKNTVDKGIIFLISINTTSSNYGKLKKN